MSIDRREMPRYPCLLRASLSIAGQRVDARVLDLGPGGAYLASAVLPTPGTELAVAIANPGADAMTTVHARVLYTVHRSSTRVPGFAVQWLELTPLLLDLVQTVAGVPSPQPLTPHGHPVLPARSQPTPARSRPTPAEPSKRQAADPRRGETRPYRMVRLDPPAEPPTRREPVLPPAPGTGQAKE